MANHLYKKLARHPGLWRVDGVGALHNGGELGARVNFQLSAIHEEFLSAPYSLSAESGEKLNYLEHVAALQNLKPGTIWRDGKRVRRAPPYGTYEINTKHASFIRLHMDANFGNGYTGSIIPEDQYLTGETRENLLPCHYAKIPVLNSKAIGWLIIPCTEILRFYYGPSARILSSILRGKSEDYYSKSLSRLENGKAILHVKQRLSRKEAAVLARDRFSPENLNAIQRVHTYISKTSANNSLYQRDTPLTIQSRFPFSDNTKLTVSGKEVLIAPGAGSGRPVTALLVMEILHCSYPFPFSTLVLESDKPFGSEGADGEQLKSGNRPRYTPDFAEDEEEDVFELDSEIKADARLKRLSEIIPTNQLGGIDNIRFEHSRPKNGTEGGTYNPEALILTEGLTQNDGDYSEDGNGHLGTSHFLSHVDVARDLSVFLEMLNHMRHKKKSDGWNIETISFKDSITRGDEFICSFPTKIGKKRRWHLVLDDGVGVRPRQVVLAEFTCSNDRIFYLAEMELQPDDSKQCTIIIKTKQNQKLEEETFDSLLKLSALQRRWLSPKHKWENDEHKQSASQLFKALDIHRINHPKASKPSESSAPSRIDPDKWSDHLIEKIEELMNLD